MAQRPTRRSGPCRERESSSFYKTACIGLAFLSLTRGNSCSNEVQNPLLKHSAPGDHTPGCKLDDATYVTPEYQISNKLQELPTSTNIPQKRRVRSDASPPESANKARWTGSSAIHPARQHTPQDLDFIRGITTRRQSFEGEPEMLLQNESRPISHEQLVIEVKTIYAGLERMEAKCKDIDEKQLSAAKEKNPEKRTSIKNDQWQALIALHKQV